MSRDPRQFALAAAMLGVLALIGGTLQDPAVGEGSTPVLAATAFVSSPSPAPSEPAISETTAVPTTEQIWPTTTVTAPLADPRDLTFTVYPEEVEAVATAVDASGTRLTGTGGLSANLLGEVTISVTADGYKSENILIAPDTAGTVEVYLDPPDQLVDKQMVFTTGGAPKQVAFTPDGAELWVTLLSGSGVEVYDPRTGSLLHAIDLPEAGSVEVIFNAAGTRAYVSQMETARVYEIDVATRDITRILDTGGSWTKVMVLSPDETRLWASNWVSNDVSEFNLQTGELIRRIATVTTPRGLALDDSADKLYVAGFDEGDIDVVDLATGEVSTIFHSGGALRHLVADPTSTLIFASDMAKDTIFAIDTVTDTVTARANTDRLPNTIDISPDGRVLAVSNRGRNNPETYYLPGPQWGSVLLLNAETGAILDAVVGGNQPTGLDLSPDGRWLAFSDFLDNRVTVLAVPEPAVLLGSGGGRADSYRDDLEK